MDLAHTFLSYGLNITLADSDAVFVADPRAFFASHPRADVLAHTDKLNSGLPVGDAGLEEAGAIHAVANIGLLVFRARPQTLAFVAAWREGLNQDPKAWDQTLFNQLLHVGRMTPEPAPSRLTRAWDDALLVGILPTASYSSGHVAYVSGLAAQKKLTQVSGCWCGKEGAVAGGRERDWQRGARRGGGHLPWSLPCISFHRCWTPFMAPATPLCLVAIWVTSAQLHTHNHTKTLTCAHARAHPHPHPHPLTHLTPCVR